MAQESLSWEEQRKQYEQREPRDLKDMEVGQEFEPFIFSISEKLVKEIMDVTGDRNPLYWDEMEAKRLSSCEKIVPQAVAMIYGRLSHLGDKYRPAPGGTLMGLSFWFIKPAQLGDIITSKAKVTAMEERKGKRILTWRAESVNQNGELISVMEFSGSHRI